MVLNSLGWYSLSYYVEMRARITHNLIVHSIYWLVNSLCMSTYDDSLCTIHQWSLWKVAWTLPSDTILASTQPTQLDLVRGDSYDMLGWSPRWLNSLSTHLTSFRNTTPIRLSCRLLTACPAQLIPLQCYFTSLSYCFSLINSNRSSLHDIPY